MLGAPDSCRLIFLFDLPHAWSWLLPLAVMASERREMSLTVGRIDIGAALFVPLVQVARFADVRLLDTATSLATEGIAGAGRGAGISTLGAAAGTTLGSAPPSE